MKRVISRGILLASLLLLLGCGKRSELEPIGTGELDVKRTKLPTTVRESDWELTIHRAEKVDQLDNADVYIYPGLGHGYMLPSRGDGYFPDEAAQSWERAMKVLNTLN